MAKKKKVFRAVYCGGCDTHTVTYGGKQLIGGEFAHNLANLEAMAEVDGAEIEDADDVESCEYCS